MEIDFTLNLRTVKPLFEKHFLQKYHVIQFEINPNDALNFVDAILKRQYLRAFSFIFNFFCFNLDNSTIPVGRMLHDF